MSSKKLDHPKTLLILEMMPPAIKSWKTPTVWFIKEQIFMCALALFVLGVPAAVRPDPDSAHSCNNISPTAANHDHAEEHPYTAAELQIVWIQT